MYSKGKCGNGVTKQATPKEHRSLHDRHSQYFSLHQLDGKGPFGLHICEGDIKILQNFLKVKIGV